MRYSCVKVTAELLQLFDNTIISPLKVDFSYTPSLFLFHLNVPNRITRFPHLYRPFISTDI